MLRSAGRTLFTRSLQRLVPEVEARDLVPCAAGVRAQIPGPIRRAGRRLPDRRRRSRKASAPYTCSTPPHPATASLEIARHILARVPQPASAAVPIVARGRLPPVPAPLDRARARVLRVFRPVREPRPCPHPPGSGLHAHAPACALVCLLHLLAPILYLLHRLRTRKRFNVIQSVENNLSFGKLVYSHFSHTTFLRNHPSKRRGLRAELRWLDNWLHARAERVRYPGASLLVAPSGGLAEEFTRDYPLEAARISVVPNPVSVARMVRAAGFDRDAFRAARGFGPSDIVLVFAALGHFERKGPAFSCGSVRPMPRAHAQSCWS